MFDDAVFWLTLSTLIVVLLSLTRNSSRMSNTSRLERKLDLILSHLRLDPDDGVNEKIRELVKEG